jgi:hypothetical protein
LHAIGVVADFMQQYVVEIELSERLFIEVHECFAPRGSD